MDTKISDVYSSIKTENHSFELGQIDTITNYQGMSGSPVIANGYVIGVLLVQQGGASLYSISIFDIFEKLNKLKKHFTIKVAGEPKCILFNNYTPENEPYYCERPQDLIFKNSLNINNVWVFGKSGAGKTAIINRNLIKNNIEYIDCDFGPVRIKSEDDVLEEILGCIEDKFKKDRLISEKNVIKQINHILCDVKASKIVVVIDEFGIDDEVLLKNIAEALMSLVTYVTRHYKEDGLLFAVSTIKSPIDLLKNFAKANDYFQFMCCDSWDENLSDLFDVICSSLQIDIGNMKSEIIIKANYSPRILKSIIRKIIASDVINEDSMNIAISNTLSEAVL